MNHLRIVLIGAGKMASALIGGLVGAGHLPENIWVSCPTQARLEQLKTRFGVCITQDNIVAASHADILVLAVKPLSVHLVLSELHTLILARQPLLISIAASISETSISTLFAHKIAVVRAMPNIPALVGQGMTALYAKQSLSDKQKQQAEAIFQAVGQTCWLSCEDQMNAITALSGSGPAYFFILMEALEKAGIALGLPADIARCFVVQTAMGSAYMAAKDSECLHALRLQVTSAGGGTERAIAVLESKQFSHLIVEAVGAAKKHFDGMS